MGHGSSNLTEADQAELARILRRSIDADRFPLSPRCTTVENPGQMPSRAERDMLLPTSGRKSRVGVDQGRPAMDWYDVLFIVVVVLFVAGMVFGVLIYRDLRHGR